MPIHLSTISRGDFSPQLLSNDTIKLLFLSLPNDFSPVSGSGNILNLPKTGLAWNEEPLKVQRLANLSDLPVTYYYVTSTNILI